MKQVSTLSLSRRAFIKASSTGSAAFMIGIYFDLPAKAQERGLIDNPPQPSLFLSIAPNSEVTVIVKHLDMGQGIATGLATIVAEELDADWSKMRYEFAPADSSKFKNGKLGVQGTGASTSIANSWMELRKAGAAARAMLIKAASNQWNVEVSEITLSKGWLFHTKSKNRCQIGEMAALARELPIPEKVTLKNSKQFNLIGNKQLHRIDSFSKSNATQVFGLDVHLPEMLYVAMARPKQFGATIASYDDSITRKNPYIVDVIKTKYGLAVIAKDTWNAFKGRDELIISWNTDNADLSSSNIKFKHFENLLNAEGTIAKDEGNVEGAKENTQAQIEATYSFPFLAHAPMEPLNVTIEHLDLGVRIHTGCQFHAVDQFSIAQELGIKPEHVSIKTYMSGGSFGRRANPASDYMREIAAVAKNFNQKNPLKLVWTRSDDLRGGYYRSMFMHRVRAGIDSNGDPCVWSHKVAGYSIAENTAFAKFLIKNGIDNTSVEGSYENKYAIPNFKCESYSPAKTVPVLWWRSVGHSHSAFVTETMMDELARLAKKDPMTYRLSTLKHNPRLSNVLKIAAHHASWNKKLPQHHGLGIAVNESFGSYVAHCAEVSVIKNKLKIHTITCAVDCGTIINPDIVKAQVEGAVAFALSALLYQEITFKDGEVQQSNFHDYPLLRMKDMPKVNVILVDSTEPPSGIGEPPVPTVGPAVANAIFDACGMRIRQLPFSKSGLIV